MNRVALGLLIPLHGLEQRAHLHGWLQSKACTQQQIYYTLLIGYGEHIPISSHLGNHSQTYGHSLTVIELRRRFFYGVRQRMTEIQQTSISRLALITLDNISLNLYGTINHLAQGIAIALQCREISLLQHLKQLRIGNNGRLDNLGQPRAELAR